MSLRLRHRYFDSHYDSIMDWTQPSASAGTALAPLLGRTWLVFPLFLKVLRHREWALAQKNVVVAKLLEVLPEVDSVVSGLEVAYRTSRSWHRLHRCRPGF